MIMNEILYLNMEIIRSCALWLIDWDGSLIIMGVLFVITGFNILGKLVHING